MQAEPVTSASVPRTAEPGPAALLDVQRGCAGRCQSCGPDLGESPLLDAPGRDHLALLSPSRTGLPDLRTRHGLLPQGQTTGRGGRRPSSRRTDQPSAERRGSLRRTTRNLLARRRSRLLHGRAFPNQSLLTDVLLFRKLRTIRHRGPDLHAPDLARGRGSAGTPRCHHDRSGPSQLRVPSGRARQPGPDPRSRTPRAGRLRDADPHRRGRLHGLPGSLRGPGDDDPQSALLAREPTERTRPAGHRGRREARPAQGHGPPDPRLRTGGSAAPRVGAAHLRERQARAATPRPRPATGAVQAGPPPGAQRRPPARLRRSCRLRQRVPGRGLPDGPAGGDEHRPSPGELRLSPRTERHHPPRP